MSILQPSGTGGITGLSTAVVPSGSPASANSGLTLSHLSSTPQQLTNQIVPPPTNQITATSSPVQLVPSLNSSLSSATGVSPLRPISPILSLSPVSPGLGAPAVGATSQLAPAQPLTGGVGIPRSTMLPSTILSPPMARRVLLPPSSLTSQPPLLPVQQRPIISAVPLQQPTIPQAVPLQPSLQPSLQPMMVQQQPQQYTQLVPVTPSSTILQPRHQTVGVQIPQQPLLLQPSLTLQPQFQVAPNSPQYITMAPQTNPLLVQQPSTQLAPPGTMFVAGVPAIM